MIKTSSPQSPDSAIFCGIDPGLSGAIAIILANLTVLLLEDMPTVQVSGSSIVKTQVDAKALFLITSAQGILTAAAVERMILFPKLSKTSALSLGDSSACARAAIDITGCNLVLQPTASQWKKALGVNAEKASSIALARRLFADLPRRLRHDKAEALLLAYYAVKIAG